MIVRIDEMQKKVAFVLTCQNKNVNINLETLKPFINEALVGYRGKINQRQRLLIWVACDWLHMWKITFTERKPFRCEPSLVHCFGRTHIYKMFVSHRSCSFSALLDASFSDIHVGEALHCSNSYEASRSSNLFPWSSWKDKQAARFSFKDQWNREEMVRAALSWKVFFGAVFTTIATPKRLKKASFEGGSTM